MSSTVTVPQMALSVILDEIEERAKLSREDAGFETFCIRVAATAADVPALVKALRRACERIGHISDLYCGVNDMTGRNVLEEISVILNQGRKNLHLSENGTRSDSGSEFPKSVSGRSQ